MNAIEDINGKVAKADQRDIARLLALSCGFLSYPGLYERTRDSPYRLGSARHTPVFFKDKSGFESFMRSCATETTHRSAS